MGLLGEDRKPRVDLVENDDQIVVTAEAPGFNGSKETLAGLGRIRYLFDVTINDDTLTIEGKAESKRLDGCNGDLYREIHSDDFIRTLTLPASVNCGEARASYKNGVFEVTLPKTEKTKRHAVRL
jgi:HSP20 family protein